MATMKIRKKRRVFIAKIIIKIMLSLTTFCDNITKQQEKIPKILKDKFINDKEEFYKFNEWKRWSILDKNIKRKGVKIPGFWLANRKKILRLDFEIA